MADKQASTQEARAPTRGRDERPITQEGRVKAPPPSLPKRPPPEFPIAKTPSPVLDQRGNDDSNSSNDGNQLGNDDSAKKAPDDKSSSSNAVGANILTPLALEVARVACRDEVIATQDAVIDSLSVKVHRQGEVIGFLRTQIHQLTCQLEAYMAVVNPRAPVPSDTMGVPGVTRNW